MRSKKGQVVFMNIMIGITVFILAIILIPFMKSMITTAREGLGCGNTDLSMFTQMTCVVTDMTMFLYIGIIFAVGGAYIIGRRLTSEA